MKISEASAAKNRGVGQERARDRHVKTPVQVGLRKDQIKANLFFKNSALRNHFYLPR